MNEELKIVIRAVTDNAKKEIKKVRDELNKIEEGKESVAAIKEEFAGIGKAATVAIASVTALAAAMSGLAQQAKEAQKSYGRLTTAFQNVGLGAEQAQTTFTNLFRFLGEADQATEAANLLAKLTNNEKDLAEWTTILQGVYATFPDSLPVEALAESANETAKVGQITGNLADALNWAGVSEDAFNEKLAALNTEAEREALIRSTLTSLYGNAAALYERNNAGLIANNEAQAKLNIELANASHYLTPLLTAIANMAATLLQVLAPALQAITNVLIVLVQWVSNAAKAIASFFGMASKTTSTTTSAVNGLGGSLGGVNKGIGSLNKGLGAANKQAEKLKKQTMGFDELNVIADTSSASGSTGGGDVSGGGSIPTASIPTGSIGDLGLGAVKQDLEQVEQRLQAILTLVGLVGAAITAWKILDIITNPAINIGAAFKTIGGYALIIAGALATIVSYSDAWANGINWGNMAAVIGGLTAVVIGVALAYGTLAAQFAIVTAGLALVILGVVDFIKNGATLQNTILIIGGAVAVAVALATAGLSVLVAAIIGAITAVAAFTAAILLEKPAIKSVEEAQEALTAAKEKAAEAENSYINAVDNAESAMDRLAEAEKAAGVTGAELYKQVQSGALDYANMTDAQKEAYKAYLDNEQKQKDLKTATEEFNAAKKAETLASYENQLALAKESGNYDEFKKSVVSAFENGELSADEARELIGKSMSEMGTSAQKTFMQDLPNSIKDGLNPNKYETARKKIADFFVAIWNGIKTVFAGVGTWFSNLFTNAWTGIKNAWSAVKTWFSNLWTSVKTVFSAVGTWFSSLFTNAWNGIKNAWSGVKTWFSNIWTNIKSPFSSVTSWFKNTFTSAWTAVKNVFSSGGKIFDGIKDGIASTFKTIVNGIIGGINKVIKVPFDAINKVLGKVKAVEIFGFKPFTWISTISVPQIPMLAKGGIVDSATIAMIGERGKEAVLPLENNTGWIDMLADRIAAKNNTPSKIVLTLDGRELGYAAINSINGITKQTGTLQLAIG